LHSTNLDNLTIHGTFQKRLTGDKRFGDLQVDVVGESHYQPAIRSACNWKPDTDTLFHCLAELVPEPTNPHDRHAIMVTINGACVGYLSRQDAVTILLPTALDKPAEKNRGGWLGGGLSLLPNYTGTLSRSPAEPRAVWPHEEEKVNK
jgi:hypothetical protein